MIIGSCLGSDEEVGIRSVREGCLLVMWENLDGRKGERKKGRKEEKGGVGDYLWYFDTKSKIPSFHSHSWLYTIIVHEEQTN